MKRFLSLIGVMALWSVAFGQCPPATPLSTPYFENFDALSTGITDSNFTNCWVSTTSSDPNWESESGETGSSDTGPANDVSLDGVYVYMETSSGTNGDTSGFISPAIDLANLTNPELSFYYHMYGADMSNLEVKVWNGSSWVSEMQISGEQDTSMTDPWNLGVVDLSSYSGTIKIMFLGFQGADYKGDMAIDEISVAEAATCPVATALSVNGVTATSIDLQWDVVSAATNYTVIYGPEGFDPAAGGISVSASANSLSLTGLNSVTTYDAYVITNCGTANGLADTSAPARATTACGIFTAPFTNNFDAESLDEVPNCWSYYETYSSSWVEVEDYSGANGPLSGSQSLLFYSSLGDPTDSLLAISPQLGDLTAGDKQLHFWASSDGPGLIVGTMADPTVPSSFVAIDTVVFRAEDTYQEVFIPITTANGYNGTDEYVVLAHDMSASSDYIRVDDFSYETIPACPKPTAGEFVAVSNSSVSLSFDPRGGTNYDYIFGPAGFNQATITTIPSSTSNPIVINGLAGAQTYDVFVRNNCTAGSNGVSEWAGPYTITTLCDPLTAPYSYDFESPSEPDLDFCWTAIEATSSTLPFVGTENARSYAGAQSLELYNGTSTDGALMAVSPAFSDLDNGKRISFYTYDDDGASDLIIGTMTSPLDTSTFTPYDTILEAEMDDDAWELFIVSFENYTGSDQYIVFKHSMSTSYDNIYIDDFTYEETPSCIPPVITSLGAYGITPTTTEVYWGGGTAGIKTYVEVGATGFTPGTNAYSVLDSVAGSTDTLSLTGLSPQTDYEFYVADSCATEGLSPWVGPFSFTTACSPLSTPHTETFDSTAIPACWLTYSSTGEMWTFGSNSYAPNSDHTGNGGEYATVDDSESPSTPDATLESPLFDVSGLTNPQLSFFVASENDQVTLSVDVWDGTTWNIGAFSMTSATDSTWDEVNVNLLPFASGGVIAVRFVVDEKNGEFRNDIAIDDVSITNGPACPAPVSLNVSGVVDTSATIEWIPGSTGTSSHVWFGPQGFYQGTTTTAGTKVVVTGNSLLVDTLTGNMCYEFVVRNICAAGDSSATWSGPFTFCTPCSAVQAPYYENFDGVSTPVIPDCWTEVETSSSTIQTVSSTDHNAAIPSGANAVEFNIVGTEFATLVSPELEGLSTGLYQVEVKAAFEGFGDGYPDTLMFGTMASPGNSASFVSYDTIVLEGSDGSFQEFRFYMDNTSLIGSNGYVAFRYLNSGGNWEYYIDDFAYELIESCPEPYALGAMNIGSTSADLFWTGYGSGNWEVEYGTQGFAQGTGMGASAANDTFTLSGISSNTTYDVYVREICGTGDSSTWAGPVTFRTECSRAQKLAGVYTIDSALPAGGTNYTSFEEAITDLTNCGVKGHVTFNVAAGTYNQRLALNEYPGVTADSTITFNGGMATSVTLRDSSGSDSATVYFDGADYITVKNMTIENYSSSDAWGVMLQNAANYNTVDSCIINMPVGSTTDVIGVVASASNSSETSTGDNANHFTLSNSTILGGEAGIALTGGSSNADYNTNNSIINNSFLHQDDHAIDIDGQVNLSIIGNHIDSLVDGGADAVYLEDVDDFEVSANTIINSPDYGLYILDGNDGNNATSRSKVINNMVISTSDFAIYLNDVEKVDVFHNSTLGEPGFQMNDQDSVDIRNNIFTSNGDHAFDSYDDLNAGDVVDYNLYYASSTDPIEVGTNTYTDLAAWQAADAARNVNSVEGDPLFAGPEDLHLIGQLANDAGTNSVGVNVDIDGDVRPASGASSVDLGADEYTPLATDVAVVEILSPRFVDCGDSANSIVAVIKNFGIQGQTGFSVSADVTGAVTANLSTTYTGTLNSLETDTVTLSSFNAVAGGNISFDVYTALAGDQDNSNDTVSGNASLTSVVAPVPTVAVDTTCEGAYDTLYFPAGGTDDYYWMTTNNDTLGTSDSLVVGPLNAADTTFLLGASGSISFNLGPFDNSIGGGGNFSNAGAQQLYFDVQSTITIDSFAVYPDAAGDVLVNLYNQNGDTIQVDTFIVAGPGKTMLPVNFTVAPGSYQIDAEGSTTGGLYRNNGGASYPYSVPGVMEITGNSFDPDYYHYFYDWHISSAGCAVPNGSISIYNSGNAVVPSFTSNNGAPTANDLIVSFNASGSTGATTYEWKFGDGNTGTGVNTQHTYTANGTYTVTLIATGDCGTDSLQQTITVQGIDLLENTLGRSLNVYPNPTSGAVTVAFDAQASSEAVVRLMDLSGREIKRFDFTSLNGEFEEQISLDGLSKGVYLIEIQSDDMRAHRRISLQ